MSGFGRFLRRAILAALESIAGPDESARLPLLYGRRNCHYYLEPEIPCDCEICAGTIPGYGQERSLDRESHDSF